MVPPPQTLPHLVIVVTGANSGIGFAICQRLIAQLSCPSPPDVLPRGNSDGTPPLRTTVNFLAAAARKLTLVLACRSAERANVARQFLLAFMDAQVSRQRKSAGYNGYAEDFRRGLKIDHLSLDLASMESVFDFAEKAHQRYPYVTHLILNAGVFGTAGLDWIVLIRQFLAGPVAALTTPRFVMQPVGTESPDGLGLVWQSNVFGHYCLARLMEPLLLANPYRDSRIEWVSSLDTEVLDPSDIQLRQARCSYQASKYQIDLIATVLARTAAKKNIHEDRAHISHLLVHPGVCHTNIAASFLGFFMVTAKLLSFILARIFGSQNHPMASYKGAIAPVYASLAPASVLQDQCVGEPQKFGSRCTVFGREYVGIDPVPDWEENAEHASELVGFCEKLYLTFMKARGDTPSLSPTDSGIGLG